MGEKDRDYLIKNPNKKIHVYKVTALIQVVLVLLILIGFVYYGESISVIGLSFIKKPLWAGVLIISVLIIILLLQYIKISKQKAEALRNQFKPLLYIAPTTLLEYKWAVVMSIIVGTFEEIIFRGFLFWQLSNYIYVIPAIIVTNIIFGLSHYGTGIKNAINAFFLGLIWSAAYYFTDSLWLPIFGHILMDVYSSTLSKKIFSDNNKVD